MSEIRRPDIYFAVIDLGEGDEERAVYLCADSNDWVAELEAKVARLTAERDEFAGLVRLFANPARNESLREEPGGQVRVWGTGSLLDEARKGRSVPSSVVGTADHYRVVASLREQLEAARAETPENIECLAREAHTAWSGWMEYLFRKCAECGTESIIPAWAVERWKRQASTAYDDLPEDEKESDRDEARRYIRALREGGPRE